MNVYPFCYVCPRDWRLFELLVKSLRVRPQPDGIQIGKWTAFFDRAEAPTKEQSTFCIDERISMRFRPDGFHPWNGWPHAMSKLAGWKAMLKDYGANDEDYFVYCDSDTFFWDTKIFYELRGSDFIGFPHTQKVFISSLDREWSWMSGCFQAARVGKVREMVNLTAAELERCRQEMLWYKLSHNEDVVISFLMAKVRAKENKLSSEFAEFYFREAFAGEVTPKSFSHMQVGPEVFLGVPISGKWDIPMALEKAGIKW